MKLRVPLKPLRQIGGDHRRDALHPGRLVALHDLTAREIRTFGDHNCDGVIPKCCANANWMRTVGITASVSTRRIVRPDTGPAPCALILCASASGVSPSSMRKARINSAA